MQTYNYKKHTSKNPLQKHLINNFFETMIKQLKFLKIDNVLDVGCGEGFTLNKLKKQKIGKTHEGIDVLDEALELGKKLYPNLNLKKGDIYKLPYENNQFDLVINTEVLEHLEKPKDALKELIRVSRKYVLLSVPNEPIFRIANFLRGKNIKRCGNDIEHIQHWSSADFVKFVKKGKVKVVSKQTPFPWTMLLVKK